MHTPSLILLLASFKTWEPSTTPALGLLPRGAGLPGKPHPAPRHAHGPPLVVRSLLLSRGRRISCLLPLLPGGAAGLWSTKAQRGEVTCWRCRARSRKKCPGPVVLPQPSSPTRLAHRGQRSACRARGGSLRPRPVLLGKELRIQFRGPADTMATGLGGSPLTHIAPLDPHHQGGESLLGFPFDG